MDRRFTPRKRVTSPTWGPPPPCKQALTTSPSRGALSRDYWVVAKHVNKTMAGKSLAPRWVTPHLSCKREQIKMSDYKDRQVTLPKWVTSPTWVPLLHVRRAKECDPVYLRRLIYWLIDWQIIVAGRCQKFDYGREGNLRHYHQVCLLIVFFFHLLDCGLMKISHSIITRIRVFLKT